MNVFWSIASYKTKLSSAKGIAKILILMTLALFYTLPKESRASDVPLNPVNTRIIIVAKDGSGQYSSIQKALNNSQPGDTIQVKNGTYNEAVHFDKSGTPEKPIALVNYPQHSPIIRPGGSKALKDVANNQRVDIRADWIILEGFEITNGWDGITANNHQHITIRRNYIHHNHNQGVYTGSSSDVLIEDNIVEWNGTETCNIGSGYSPRHCHGMYLNSQTRPVSNLTVRRNIVRNHGGNGIMLKTTNLRYGHTNDLVEDNIIENNAQNGIALFQKVSKSLIRNNTVIVTSIPSSNAPNTSLVAITNSTGNTFKNNTFYTTLNNVLGFYGRSINSDQNTFDSNRWKVISNNWQWKGKNRSDFKTKYQSVTRWDTNGQCCEIDPGFVDKTGGDNRLRSISPKIK